MRKVIEGVVGCLLLFAVAITAAPAFAADQYPDLKTLPPRDLRFDSVDVGGGDTTATGFHDVLRFSNTVWNAGPGKLVLRGALDPVTKRGPAYQRVYDTSGSFTELSTGSDMYYHPSHDHYHFEDWGTFQLWTAAKYDAWVAGGGATVQEQTGSKTTSCVLDEEFIAEVMGASWPGVFGFGGCNPDSSGNLMEGLSAGWGDTYDWWRADQWVDLGVGGKLQDGDYVLRSVVDPTNKIYESPGRGDASKEATSVNSAITRFSVRSGALVDSDAPTGTITIANAQATTETPQITLKSLGRDDVKGVDQYRVSNNGSTWKTMTYDGSGSTPAATSWDLSNATYGGTSSLGTKTVYVQFHDYSGKWGPTQTDTIQLVSPPAQSAYSQAVLSDGPASFWRLGETSGTAARDERAANPGVYVNAPGLGAASLVASDPANKAVNFDGTADYMKAGPGAALDLGSAITLEAWITPSSLPTAGNFASVVTKPEAYSLQFNGPRLEFTVMQNNVRKRLQATAGAIVAGQTYHVVATYDGTTQRLYINGVQNATAALTGAASTTTAAVFVGSWDGNQEFYKGAIDDVAVYGKTLTAARVQSHYDTGKGAPVAQPPAAPTGLGATAFSDTRVDLSWADNSTDESSFTVERSTDSAFTSPTTINVANDKTSYSDTGLTASTTYWYRVRSRNAVGNSAWSNVASVTTKATAPPAAPPAAPSNTGATPVTSSRIDVSWTDNSTNEANFVVDRSTSSTFATVTSTTVPAGTTSLADTGLAANTAYWYRVRAVNAAGSSANSTPATATTKPAPASYAADVISDAPVSYWRLGETSGTSAADQRAANTGTYLGAPALGSGSLLAADTTNKAVSFDGTNDAVDVLDSNSLDLTSGVTLEAWIKPNLLPAAGQFASVVTKAEAYSLQFNGPRLEFTVMQNGLRKRLQAASGAIVTGQTYHVVATYDGTTQRLYLNGAQVVSVPLTGAATVTPTDLDIGSWDGGSEFFSGVIDDVAVYNQALSAPRIASHYSAGSSSGTTTTPPPATAPAAPSTLAAVAASDTRVDVSWKDNSTDETSFVVERSPDSSFSAPQATTLAAGTTSWADTGRAANTTYWYRVKAVNSAGSSAYSNSASATTKPAPASYSAAVVADAPVSYWRLGETTGTAAADQRSANPGSYAGAPALGAASLLATDSVNKAVTFDGTNDVVVVPDSNSLDLTTGITLEAWIKPGLLPPTGSFASLVTKPESYSLQFNGPRLEFTVMQNGVRQRLQAPSGAIVSGQGFHVVATFDGTTQRLYINGIESVNRALTGAATVTPRALAVGAWDAGSEFFNGVVDDVAVYNRALSAATVGSHFTAGRGVAPAAGRMVAPARISMKPAHASHHTKKRPHHVKRKHPRKHQNKHPRKHQRLALR